MNHVYLRFLECIIQLVGDSFKFYTLRYFSKSSSGFLSEQSMSVQYTFIHRLKLCYKTCIQFKNATLTATSVGGLTCIPLRSYQLGRPDCVPGILQKRNWKLALGKKYTLGLLQFVDKSVQVRLNLKWKFFLVWVIIFVFAKGPAYKQTCLRQYKIYYVYGVIQNKR